VYSTKLRTEIESLRAKGLTYTEIQRTLKTKIPKSTISGWLKMSPVPADYYEKVIEFNKKHLIKARKIALKRQKERREIYLKEILGRNMNVLQTLDKGALKLILAILYLGEGAKYKSSKFLALANSNPEIIQIYIKLLNTCFPTNPDKFRARVQVRYDQNITEMENYWEIITGIPNSQFYPTYVDKRTLNKETKKTNYRGVCTVIYFNTDFQLELEILANSVVQYIIPGR